MRFMLMFRSTVFSEAGVKQDPDFVSHRTAYARSLAHAGVLLADESLLPSSSGLRFTVRPDGSGSDVAAGPFPEDDGLLDGFMILDARSVEEATEWALKAPMPKGRGGVTLELRQLADSAAYHRDPIHMAMLTSLREQM